MDVPNEIELHNAGINSFFGERVQLAEAKL